MKTFPANHYRNPLDILIDAENRSCKGCKYLDSLVVLGERMPICHKSRKPTKKCSQYREAE